MTRVGDVVYVEGASAILGDVVHVEGEEADVIWRPTLTTEQLDELVVVDDPPKPPLVRGNGTRVVVCPETLESPAGWPLQAKELP